MKNFLRNAGKATLFIAIIVVILLLLGPLFTPKDNTDAAGVLSEHAAGYLAEPEDSLDLVFIGDSECYSAFIPLQLWDEYGIASYNCASSAQRLYESYDYLKSVLQTQHPQVVVLETNALFRRTTLNKVFYYYARTAIPFLYYHDNWKSLSTEDVEYTHHETFYGYRPRLLKNGVPDDAETEKDSTVKSITFTNRFLLERIIRLCQDNNIQLILVTTPSTKNWDESRHDVTVALAKKEGLTYLDLNKAGQTLEIDWKTDTYDQGDHLNYSGASKVTAWMGLWLSKKTDLPDHRGDSAYAQWNIDLEEFNEAVHNN